AQESPLPDTINDNRIINQLLDLGQRRPELDVVLVSKDINMRLKARACGIAAEDYQTDQLVDDVSLLSRGYHSLSGSFWERVGKVETRQDVVCTRQLVMRTVKLPALIPNGSMLNEQGFVGWIKRI